LFFGKIGHRERRAGEAPQLNRTAARVERT
jgi:hypothetical protein